MTNTKAVIFDFDGVITRTEPIHLRSFRETVAPLGIKIDSRRWYSEFTGVGGKRIMEILFGENCITENLEEWTEKRRALFMKYALGGARFHTIRGLRQFLRKLHGMKIFTAIASGSRREMFLPILERLKIKNEFCTIVGGEDVENKKPHPEPYLKAAELLGVSPKECIAIEDSENGIASARAAGMRVVCIRSPFVPTQSLKYNLPIIDNFTKFPISVL